MEIKDPNGAIVSKRDITQEKSRARQYYYNGRKFSGQSLKPGTYTGTIEIMRQGLRPIKRTEKIIVK